MAGDQHAAHAASRYAVIGHPVAHSRSPQIHQAFGQQTNRSIDYGLLPAEPDQFITTVDTFRADGGRGLNVTVPFKEQAVALAGHVSDRAKIAGAANTLSFNVDGIHADNTDGAGLVNDLSQRWQQTLQGAAVVLLGAGGAARGVLHPLLDSGVRQLWIANRTAERAHALVELANTHAAGASVQAVVMDVDSLMRVSHETPDANGGALIVINATAAGLAGQALPVPSELLCNASLCYDMVYADQPTVFMAQASAAGCHQVVDGLGMLVEQAAESFAIWHGVRPLTEPVFRQLRSSTGG